MKYTVVYHVPTDKYGIMRVDAFHFDDIVEAQEQADFLTKQSKAGALLGSITSGKKAKSSAENGKTYEASMPIPKWAEVGKITMRTPNHQD